MVVVLNVCYSFLKLQKCCYCNNVYYKIIKLKQTATLMRELFLIIAATTVLINACYYLQIREGKKLKEFIMNFFNWTTKIMIKNYGANYKRKRYLKVNNYCMLIFWFSIMMQVIILFQTDK